MPKTFQKKTFYRKRYPARTKKSKPLKEAINEVLDSKLETKELYFDSGLTALPFSSSSRIIPLIAQGNVSTGTYTVIEKGYDDDNRIGDEITIKRIQVKFRFVVSGTSPDVARLVIFRWKPFFFMSSTPEALFSEVLYATAAQDYQSAMSFPNNKKSQYTILVDKLFKLDTAVQPVHIINISIRTSFKCEFKGENGMNNQVFAMLIAEGAPTNSFVFSALTTYKDG